MKSSQFSRLLIVAAALIFTTTAFASSNVRKGSVTLGDAVQVNGKELPAGDYTVTWDGDGPNVNLNFLRDGKKLASAPATVKQLDNKAASSAAEVKSNAGGRELTAVRFAGKNIQLEIAPASTQAEANSGSAVK